MEELVGDGKLNWGRVVSLFTFTGVLVTELYTREEGRDCCQRLAHTIADYLGEEKRDWLMENDGWVRTISLTVADKTSSLRIMVRKPRSC